MQRDVQAVQEWVQRESEVVEKTLVEVRKVIVGQRYMLERMMTHGVRRAAEMGEVASTLEELGLGTALADATMERQQRIGELGLIAQSPDYRVLADQILESLTPAGEIGGGQNYSTIEQKE